MHGVCVRHNKNWMTACMIRLYGRRFGRRTRASMVAAATPYVRYMQGRNFSMPSTGEPSLARTGREWSPIFVRDGGRPLLGQAEWRCCHRMTLPWAMPMATLPCEFTDFQPGAYQLGVTKDKELEIRSNQLSASHRYPGEYHVQRYIHMDLSSSIN